MNINKQYTTCTAIKPSCSEPNQTGWDCSSSPHSGRGRALPFTTSSPLNTFEPQIRSSSRHTHIQPQPPLVRDRLLCLQALLSTFSYISLYSFKDRIHLVDVALKRGNCSSVLLFIHCALKCFEKLHGVNNYSTASF